MKKCSKCKIDKELDFYYVSNKSTCKDCILIMAKEHRHKKKRYKSVLKKNDILILEEKRKSFIEEIKRKALYVDYVDAFRMVDIFTDIYGVINTNLEIEDELIWMWSKINLEKSEF